MIQCGFRDVAPLFGGLISRVRERDKRGRERESASEREKAVTRKLNVAMVIHARRSRLRWLTPAFTDQLTNVWTLNRYKKITHCVSANIYPIKDAKETRSSQLVDGAKRKKNAANCVS